MCSMNFTCILTLLTTGLCPITSRMTKRYFSAHVFSIAAGSLLLLFWRLKAGQGLAWVAQPPHTQIRAGVLYTGIQAFY